MIASRVLRAGRAPAIVIGPMAAVLGIATHAAPVRADNVGELVRQLENDDSDKVRLSAALNLTKLGDPRAILPLTKAGSADTDRAGGGAAAVGLGKLVTDKTEARIRKLAIAALS